MGQAQGFSRAVLFEVRIREILVVQLRSDDDRDRLPDGFLFRISKQPLRSPVPRKAAKFHGFLARPDAAGARRVNRAMEPAVRLRGMEL